MQPQSEYGPINERRMEVANDDLDERFFRRRFVESRCRAKHPSLLTKYGVEHPEARA